MRSRIKSICHNNDLTTEGAKGAELSMWIMKGNLMRRLRIFVPVLAILMLTACDQAPTTLDEEPYLGDSGETTFSIEIKSFEFDYLSQQFFFSVEVTSPNEIAEVAYNLDLFDSPYLLLNDLGQDHDILIGDGRYDGSWTLPDSMSTYVDSLWTLEVLVEDIQSNGLSKSKTIQPEIPAPPVIGEIWHRDTVQLVVDTLILDTLSVQITHPNGLDEIRDVWLKSLKPDSTWSNQNRPIHLFDDGGSIVFFTYKDIDFTSGDKIEGDGIYSLTVGFEADQFTQIGLYQRTFYARSWFGIVSESVQDSLVLLGPGSLSPADENASAIVRIFQ